MGVKRRSAFGIYIGLFEVVLYQFGELLFGFFTYKRLGIFIVD